MDLFVGGGWWGLRHATLSKDTRLIDCGALGWMMARTAILVDELIILTLHSRVEALISGDLLAVGTSCRTSTTLCVAAQMRSCLISWTVRFNRVLLVRVTDTLLF